MVRPQKNRMVAFNPEISYFKPRGIPMSDLEEVCLTVDQREAIRLSDLLGMSHEDAGRRMGVSPVVEHERVRRIQRDRTVVISDGEGVQTLHRIGRAPAVIGRRETGIEPDRLAPYLD